jgi:hypothetical protein
MTGEQVDLRRIVVEAQLEIPVRLCSSGRTARKQIPFIREDQGPHRAANGGKTGTPLLRAELPWLQGR